jgi:hypothetical protein
MTLENLHETLGLTDLDLYGNDYVSSSAQIARNLAFGTPDYPQSFLPGRGRYGTICPGDSTHLDHFVPANAFDLVYTGYISSLFNALGLGRRSNRRIGTPLGSVKWFGLLNQGNQFLLNKCPLRSVSTLLIGVAWSRLFGMTPSGLIGGTWILPLFVYSCAKMLDLVWILYYCFSISKLSIEIDCTASRLFSYSSRISSISSSVVRCGEVSIKHGPTDAMHAEWLTKCLRLCADVGELGLD